PSARSTTHRTARPHAPHPPPQSPPPCPPPPPPAPCPDRRCGSCHRLPPLWAAAGAAAPPPPPLPTPSPPSPPPPHPPTPPPPPPASHIKRSPTPHPHPLAQLQQLPHRPIHEHIGIPAQPRSIAPRLKPRQPPMPLLDLPHRLLPHHAQARSILPMQHDFEP